ncbi:trypsin-like serine protease [Altererythrobacter luteolus]|uniref:Trypsin-like serine protease n=1 Tax=Pontixanthobacter luteolus TaxID=295089 RepID=A0A6I4UZE6_9SPHN|nr:serine protease [Pontixanthobacter luteolus]MXP46146.1 trypsin-like serine protease [Pontixanthobacter luteolus]
MKRFLILCAALFGLLIPAPSFADPADINAAARGVVRVVIIGTDGTDVYPVSHGSGFAVSPTRIVTNAHVVTQAAQDDTLRIGIVPSEGNDANYAKILSISPRNDLALVEITGSLRLPPLTISGNPNSDSGEVSSVGYPMNVDQAQGLDLNDIFNSQPPVKSRGFISGARPSRQFDTILHTAPIARGNSGGPLLDGCGRVLGVNSFGADSGGSDAEFFFAVSTKELLPFLRANNVNARVNALPCRSLADLDEAERERIERQQTAARAELAERAEQTRAKRDRVQLEAEQAVQEERENTMALAFLLVLLGVGAGVIAWQAWMQQGEPATDGDTHDSRTERKLMIAGTVAAAALIAALALWFTRPGLDAIDRRVNAAMNEDDGSDGAKQPASSNGEGTLLCTLQLDRSRVTGTPDPELQFTWAEDGCVNERTQYGFSGGTWSRIFVPNQEDAVSVNRYDPVTGEFRTDRYLLSRNAMTSAREARGKYTPPKCGTDGAAASLGDMQGAVTAMLPQQPNERLVYKCEARTD